MTQTWTWSNATTVVSCEMWEGDAGLTVLSACREAVGVSTAVLGKAEKRSLTHDEVCKSVGAVGGDGFKLEGDVDTQQLDLAAGALRYALIRQHRCTNDI